MNTNDRGPKGSDGHGADAAATQAPHDHARAWECLPWLVNGSATDEQQRLAERHLPHCADCRAELALQERLHAAMRLHGSRHEAAGPDALPDPEAGLARLLRRLDTPAEEQPRPAVAPGRNRFMVALAVASVLQAVVLGWSLSLQWRYGDAAAFQTLSQPAASLQAPGWRVVPDAAMSLAEWQALLQSLGLQVVEGPNTAGAYVLVAVDAQAGEAGHASGRLLARLREAKGIRLAEPLRP